MASQKLKHQGWIDVLVERRTQVDELVDDIAGLLKGVKIWVEGELATWDHADAIPRLAHLRWMLVGLRAREENDPPDDFYRIHIVERRSAATGGQPAAAAAPAKGRRRRAGRRVA